MRDNCEKDGVDLQTVHSLLHSQDSSHATWEGVRRRRRCQWAVDSEMYHNLVKAHICHLLLIWMNENRNILIYSHVFLYSYILVKQRWRQHSLLRSPAIWYLSPGTLRTSPAFCGACFYILKYCWCIQLIGATNATEYQGMNLTCFAASLSKWNEMWPASNKLVQMTCFKQDFARSRSPQ